MLAAEKCLDRVSRDQSKVTLSAFYTSGPPNFSKKTDGPNARVQSGRLVRTRRSLWASSYANTPKRRPKQNRLRNKGFLTAIRGKPGFGWLVKLSDLRSDEVQGIGLFTNRSNCYEPRITHRRTIVTIGLLQKPKGKESRGERGRYVARFYFQGRQSQERDCQFQTQNTGRAPFTRNCIAMTIG